MAGLGQRRTAVAAAFAPSDPVLLVASEEGRTQLSRAGAGMLTLRGGGTFDSGRLVGLAHGATLKVAGVSFVAYPPAITDLHATMERQAQVVEPFDGAVLALLCNVGAGSVVLEAGSGSGGLTLTLAHLVGDAGHVHSVDRNERHQPVAERNVQRAGPTLAQRVTFLQGDLSVDAGRMPGLEQDHAVDAILLDLPEPWTCLGAIERLLRPGGFVGCYLPTFNQVEQWTIAATAGPLTEQRALEVLSRDLKVAPGATRPSSRMMGHTAFLCTARRTAATVPSEG